MVAVSFDKRCSGSLGARASRKQFQALIHLASGNEEMRVNSGSSIPSTCALCIPAFIGKGKTVYFRLVKRCSRILRDGVFDLDKEIFYKATGSKNQMISDKDGSSELLEFPGPQAEPKKQQRFCPREFLPKEL